MPTSSASGRSVLCSPSDAVSLTRPLATAAGADPCYHHRLGSLNRAKRMPSNLSALTSETPCRLQAMRLPVHPETRSSSQRPCFG
jgi:hypothetical protein